MDLCHPLEAILSQDKAVVRMEAVELAGQVMEELVEQDGKPMDLILTIINKLEVFLHHLSWEERIFIIQELITVCMEVLEEEELLNMLEEVAEDIQVEQEGATLAEAVEAAVPSMQEQIKITKPV